MELQCHLVQDLFRRAKEELGRRARTTQRKLRIVLKRRQLHVPMGEGRKRVAEAANSMPSLAQRLHIFKGCGAHW